MNFKKCIFASALSVAVTLPVIANAAYIDRIDLTGVLGAAGDDVSGVNFGDVDGGALVFQTQSGPGGTLAVGDTFTESGALELTNWNSTPLPGGEVPSGLGASYEMFFEFTSLTGEVTKVNPDGSFEYEFDPFSGDIFLKVDTTIDGAVSAGAITLGELEVFAGDGNFGAGSISIGNDGDNNMTLLFTSFTASVFYDDLGNDMSTGVNDTFVALANLDNTILGFTPTPDGSAVTVSTNGIVTFRVPEPTPLALLGCGIILAGLARRKKQK